MTGFGVKADIPTPDRGATCGLLNLALSSPLWTNTKARYVCLTAVFGATDGGFEVAGRGIMGAGGRVSPLNEKRGEGLDTPSPESRATLQQCSASVQSSRPQTAAGSFSTQFNSSSGRGST